MKTILSMVFLYISAIMSSELNPEFVLKYFAEKNVRQIVVFACWRESEVFDFVRLIMVENARMSYNHVQDHANIANILKTNYYKLGIVLDMDCPKSETILNQFMKCGEQETKFTIKFSEAELLFDEIHVWLVITNSTVVPTTNLHELPLRLDSEFAVTLTNNKDAYVLYDIYNPSRRHGQKLNVTAMGFWNTESGLKNYLLQYKYKRRQNLYGMTLNFSTLLVNEPEPDLMTYLTSEKNPHLDSMSRYHYDLVINLRDIYNFKINLKLDDTWGYYINGTFNGIVGDMLAGIVDASACHFQQRIERIGFIEYTVPTYGLKPHMFFLHPKKNSLRNQFLKPLEKSIWWLSSNLSIFFWIVLLVVLKVENYYKSNRDVSLTHPAPASDSAITIIAAVSQQGTSILPQFHAGRIVFITLFFWLLMMFQFYSASIISSLLAPEPRYINTLWDLADSELDCGFEDNKYMRYSFSFRKDPEMVYLHENKFQFEKKRKLWDNHRGGMIEVSKGGYAFSSETGSAYYTIENTFTQEQICNVAEIPLIEPQYVSLITSRRSPFKKMIIYGLRHMVEHGIVDHLIKKWTHRKPECPESYQSRPLPVALKEFCPAIFLLSAGFILAMIIMAYENLRYNLSRGKVQQQEAGQTEPT